MKEIIIAVKEFSQKNRKELIFLLGILSAGGIGYELGILRGLAQKENSVSIEIIKPTEASVENQGNIPIENPQVLGKSSENAGKDKRCVFVGSRNSTLYHLPTCAAARRIKDENKRCFASAEDATSKGYRPGCLK